MTGKWLKLIMVLALATALFGFVVSADVPPPFPKGFSTVTPNGTVFIGEEGMDISVAVPDPYTRIALFANNADPTKDTPIQVINDLSNKKSFYFDPKIFTEASQGTWYCWNGAPPAGKSAFTLAKPYIQIKAVTNPNDLDVTDKEVFQGTTLTFRIETNLYPITARDPSSPGPFTINVTGPGGSIYSALISPAGTDLSLINVPVNNNPYYWVTAKTNNGWFTGAKGPSGENYVYDTGVYHFKVACLANKLNINNPSASISSERIVTLNPETLAITANPSSVVRSKPFNLIVTGRPNTWYYVYLKDCPQTFDGAACNQPPLIVEGQENVLFDAPSGNYTIGNTKTIPECCYPGSTIRSIVPKTPFDGTRYYAYVKTDDTGKKIINLQTSIDTAAATFTYHAQGKTIDNRDIYTNPDAQVTVTKGVVTISLPANVTLGSSKFVLINGTNTETLTTFLWLKGPCQPVCGAPIDNPQVPLGIPTKVKVNQDGTWTYNWTIMDLKIDAGEYTIFAASNWSCDAPTPSPSPSPTPCSNIAYCPNRCNDCCIGCAATAQAKIIIDRPVITAVLKPNPLIRECCNDHTVTITGKATGLGVDPTTGKKMIGLWIFGDGKIADVHYAHAYYEVKCDDTFTISFGPNDPVFPVDKVAPGRYYFILQHPMYNRVLDIDLQKNPNDGANRWFVSSVCPVKWSYLFPIEGPGGKYDYAGYNGVLNALKQPCVDDIYQTFTLTVQDVNSAGMDFSANPTGGRAPLVVNFTDLSTLTEISRTWDFGDSTTSTDKNPTHTYVSDGTYTVKLSAVDQDGVTRTASKVAYINVGAVVLSASFSANPTTGMKPLTVNFTDMSYGNPTSWFWDFGDSTYSALPNPGAHTYQNAGNFTVTLTVGNGQDASSTVSQIISVRSDQPIPPGYDKIALFPGWNFVSSPKILQSGYDNASIFANVDTASHSIYEYDSTKGTWTTLTPTSQVKVLDGIWIYSKVPASVALKFSTDPIVVPPSKTLPTGWNAIGFSGLQPATARDTFFSVQSQWANAIGFDATGQKYETTIVNGGSGEFSDTRILYPTKGYWLFMKSAGTLSAIGT